MQKLQRSKETRPVRHLFDFCLCYPDTKDCTTCSSETSSDLFISSTKEPTEPKLNSSCSDWFRMQAGSSSSSCRDVHLIENESRNLRENKSLKVKHEEIRDLVESSAHTFRQMKSWYEFAYGELDFLFKSIEERVESEKKLIKIRDAELVAVCSEIEEHEETFNKILIFYQMIRAEYLRRLMDEDLMRMNRIKIDEIRSRIKLQSEPFLPEELGLVALEKQISKVVRQFQTTNFTISREPEMMTTSEMEKLLTCRSFHEADILSESSSVPIVE